jgi:hypothetical protein
MLRPGERRCRLQQRRRWWRCRLIFGVDHGARLALPLPESEQIAGKVINQKPHGPLPG